MSQEIHQITTLGAFVDKKFGEYQPIRTSDRCVVVQPQLSLPPKKECAFNSFGPNISTFHFASVSDQISAFVFVNCKVTYTEGVRTTRVVHTVQFRAMGKLHFSIMWACSRTRFSLWVLLIIQNIRALILYSVCGSGSFKSKWFILTWSLSEKCFLFHFPGNLSPPLIATVPSWGPMLSLTPLWESRVASSAK